MKGWIINLYSLAETREVERFQAPVFFTAQGEAVFEVWFWHALLERWFVMSTESDAELEQQGAVFFHPREVPERLAERVHEMERSLGIDPKQVPPCPSS
jgi:hypothetical protein